MHESTTILADARLSVGRCTSPGWPRCRACSPCRTGLDFGVGVEPRPQAHNEERRFEKPRVCSVRATAPPPIQPRVAADERRLWTSAASWSQAASARSSRGLPMLRWEVVAAALAAEREPLARRDAVHRG
jgi:hypothetical protein